MSHELISILALVAMFVVATLVPVNMGVLAFVGAFLVGTLVADMTANEVIDGFPGGYSSPWSASRTCSLSRRITGRSTGWLISPFALFAVGSGRSRGSCS